MNNDRLHIVTKIMNLHTFNVQLLFLNDIANCQYINNTFKYLVKYHSIKFT